MSGINLFCVFDMFFYSLRNMFAVLLLDVTLEAVGKRLLDIVHNLESSCILGNSILSKSLRKFVKC